MSREHNNAVLDHSRTELRQRNERGIAMIVAMFALLLLSVIGLGMMYGTNMETNINANYRDKQDAMYAAMAGLQEARDRLHPYDPTQAHPDRIDPPLGLPSVSAANVIYIINPNTGETVAPWDTSNRYMDKELCQENILGLTASTGPCTTLPPTSPAWWTAIDDSSVSSIWHLANPLDSLKWVRIQLKTNNATPRAANDSSGDSRQVCWDGKHQIVLPAGYGPECVQYGSVIAINLTNGGSGYTSAPTVTIAAPPGGGSQATATAHISPTDGLVSSIPVDSQGSGYTSVPTVTLDAPVDPTGTQATAHVCVVAAECPGGPTGDYRYIPPGAPVASVSITSAGTYCYPGTYTSVGVIFSGDGSGAAATAALGSTSCVYAWTVTGSCNAHKDETLTNIGFTGGGGSGFSGTLSFDHSGNLVTGYPTVQNSGTGYTSTPTAMTGFTGCGSLSLAVTLGKRITSPQTITPTSGGSGYTTAGVSFPTGTGTSNSVGTGTATLGTEPAYARQVRAIVMNNTGTGYSSAAPPNVYIGGGGGTGAAAHANVTVSEYKVTSITVDTGHEGSGYTADPAVTITGGGGMNAAATATIGRGANWGRVMLLTALGQTRTGARAMLQMEATTALTGYHSTAALTIDGPSPNMQNMPNSNNFYVNGNDQNSCAQTPELTRPAVGGYDDPNATPSTHSVEDIVDALPDDRYDHYVGEGDTPSVANVYDSLGTTLGTPLGLKSMLDSVRDNPQSNTPPAVDFGTPGVPAWNYIDGDVTLSGSTDGYGVLAVTGRLQMNGNFTWHGVVLVIGDGILDFGGGGNGTIIGTVLVAKIYPDPGHHADADILPTLGSPTINWNGGGGNSILYDHCWTTNLMSRLIVNPPVVPVPLKVLSFRNLPY